MFIQEPSVLTVKELIHFPCVLKVWVKFERKDENVSFFYCIWTEACGMERCLGARENTDALIFKKAASHFHNQNHTIPLPLNSSHTLVPAAVIHYSPSWAPHEHKNKDTQSAPVHRSYAWICGRWVHLHWTKSLELDALNVNKHLMLQLHLKDMREPPSLPNWQTSLRIIS